MRLSNILVAVMLLVSFAFAQTNEKYIQPKESIVGVYANQTRAMYEEATFKVTPDDRLLVIAEKGNFYQVKNADGQTGWIEKRLCINLGKSKSFKFDQAEVVGYLDNPTPVYILDSDDPNAERIYLDRSFKDAIRDNVDHETVARQASK